MKPFSSLKVALAALVKIALWAPAVCMSSAYALDQWEIDADLRIDTLRKANLSVQVVDQNGGALPGAVVNVEMQRHAFRFGTELGKNTMFGYSSTDATYANKVRENFNAVTFGNDFKWALTDNKSSSFWNSMKSSLNKLRSERLKLRVHTMLWGRDYSGTAMPNDVFNKVNSYTAGASDWSPPATWTQAQIDQWIADKAWVKGRIMGGMREQLNTLKLYPDVVATWDIINEEVRHSQYLNFFTKTEYDLMVAEMSIEIKAAMPNIDLYYNEFSLLKGNPGSRHTTVGQRIKELQAAGALINGMGSQTHGGSVRDNFDLSNPNRVYDRIQYLIDQTDDPNLRFSIVEFDYQNKNISASITEADRLERVHALYKQSFSHANVDEITMWGLWDGNHWKKDSPMYDDGIAVDGDNVSTAANWALKPQGQVIQNLIKTEWWTNNQGITDADGNYTTRAFKGDYNVKVTIQGEDYHFTEDDFTADASIQLTIPMDFSTTPDYTLTYTSGLGGAIAGNAMQVVKEGFSGTEVTAEPNAGYSFVNWSDSSTANPRTDLSVTSDVTVNANFVSDAALFYVNWESAHSVASGRSGDDDGDGVSNLLEYALDGSPNQNDAGTILPVSQIVVEEDVDYFEYVYTRRTDAAARGLTYTLLSTQDISSGWSSTVIPSDVTAIGPDFESVTSRLPVGAPQQFIKLEVEMAP